MSNVVVELSGDEAKLVASYQRAVAAAAKLGTEIDKGAAAAIKADKESRKFADGVKELQVTPLERYRQEMEKLNEAQTKGLLTQQQAAIHQEYLTSRLTGTNVAAEKLGVSVLAGAVSMASGYATVQGAINLATAAINEFDTRNVAATASARDLAEASVELLTIAEVMKWPELTGQSVDLARTGIGLEKAMRLVFDANSSPVIQQMSNKEEFLRTIANADARGLVPAQSSLLAAELWPGMTRGQITPEQTLALPFLAAEPTTKSPAQMQEIIGKILPVYTSAGFSPAETSAIATVGSMEFPDNTDTMAKAFAAKMTRSQELVAIKGFANKMNYLESRPDIQEELFKEDYESRQMYKTLRERRTEVEQYAARNETGIARGSKDFIAMSERAVTEGEPGRVNAARVAADQAKVKSDEAIRKRSAVTGFAIEEGRNLLGAFLNETNRGYLESAISRTHYFGSTFLAGRNSQEQIREVLMEIAASSGTGWRGEINGPEVMRQLIADQQKVPVDLGKAAADLSTAASQLKGATATAAPMQRAQANMVKE